MLQRVLTVLRLLSGRADGQVAISAAGAASPLVKLANGSRSSAQRNSSVILCNLAQSDGELSSLLVSGAAVPIVALLRDGEAEVQELAVAAVRQLTQMNSEGSLGEYHQPSPHLRVCLQLRISMSQ